MCHKKFTLTTSSPSDSPSASPSILPTMSMPSAMATASSSQNAVLVPKVRVQLLGTNALHMREVEVFDTSGVNRALNNPASQSSTNSNLVFGLCSASNSVNGNFNDISITESESGTYQECFQHHVIHPKIAPFSHSCS